MKNVLNVPGLNLASESCDTSKLSANVPSAGCIIGMLRDAKDTRSVSMSCVPCQAKW